MDSLATTIADDLTSVLSTFSSAFIEDILPTVWSILAVAAVIGFVWLLIRRFAGR